MDEIIAAIDWIYSQQRFLLQALGDLGYEGLVKNYIIALSIKKLSELRDERNIQYTQEVWVAWDHLALVEWCWLTPFSFFASTAVPFGAELHEILNCPDPSMG